MFTVPGIGWPVRWYGLFFAFAFLAGFSLFRWQTERGGRGPEAAASFIVPGFLGTVLGARAGHIIFYNFRYFLEDPLWFFRIWEGGLSSHGATAGLLVALWWHSRRARQPFWDLCDRFSFSAAAGAALIRVGNLFNSEIVGRTAPPGSRFGVVFPRYDGIPAAYCPARYPTQALEFLLGAAVLGLLLLADRLMGREKRPRGALAALFLILYFAGRFGVEFLKERQNAADSLLLSRGQLLSVLPFLFGAGLLVWAFGRTSAPAGPAPWEPPGSRTKKASAGAARGAKAKEAAPPVAAAEAARGGGPGAADKESAARTGLPARNGKTPSGKGPGALGGAGPEAAPPPRARRGPGGRR
jgi:prolipoprotein diacylglyceryl transferase